MSLNTNAGSLNTNMPSVKQEEGAEDGDVVQKVEPIDDMHLDGSACSATCSRAGYRI